MIMINIKQAVVELNTCLKANLVPFFRGSPGIGKSSFVAQVAKEFNLKLIDVRLSQCDPTDLNGFPEIDPVSGKARYCPMDIFPVEGDKVPDGYDGWLIFFDELNAADRGTQKASYKVFLDRMIGNRKLHPRVRLCAAGNLDTDNAITEEMSTALQSRLVHYHLISCAETFLSWAEGNKIDSRIMAFIRTFPGKLNTFDPKKSTVEPTFACERTWHMASDLCKHIDPSTEAAVITLGGTISEGIAREFKLYCQIYAELPTVAEMISNPDGAKMPGPQDPGTLHAICGSVADNATEKNIAPLMRYVERMPLEFQAICLRVMGRRDRTMLHTPPVTDWCSRNNTLMFN